MRTTGKRHLGVALLVLLVAMMPHDTSRAQSSALDLSPFAVPAQDFPAGSAIVVSQPVTAGDLLSQHLHIGPDLPSAPVAGYYLQAVAHDNAGAVRLVTSILVSVLASPDLSAAAFNLQDGYWQNLSVSAPGTVQALNLQGAQIGDSGFNRGYMLRDPNGHTHSEIFFVRGQIFVELYLDSFSQQPQLGDTQSFMALAVEIDAIALHEVQPAFPLPTARSTATPVPSDTPLPTTPPTATDTPMPTMTPTPAPTATATPLPQYKPVRERPRCKKGYRFQHGKCKRVRHG